MTTLISNFLQIRTDGKIVPAGMTVHEMLSRGWVPSKVVSLRWSSSEADVEFPALHGVHGIPVPGGNYVAAILDEDDSGINSRLVVLSPDGSVHGRLQNKLVESGLNTGGRFIWFEPAMNPGVDRFGVVFQTDTAGQYRCDIDARGLALLSINRIG